MLPPSDRDLDTFRIAARFKHAAALSPEVRHRAEFARVKGPQLASSIEEELQTALQATGCQLRSTVLLCHSSRHGWESFSARSLVAGLQDHVLCTSLEEKRQRDHLRPREAFKLTETGFELTFYVEGGAPAAQAQSLARPAPALGKVLDHKAVLQLLMKEFAALAWPVWTPCTAWIVQASLDHIYESEDQVDIIAELILNVKAIRQANHIKGKDPEYITDFAASKKPHMLHLRGKMITLSEAPVFDALVAYAKENLPNVGDLKLLPFLTRGSCTALEACQFAARAIKRLPQDYDLFKDLPPADRDFHDFSGWFSSRNSSLADENRLPKGDLDRIEDELWREVVEVLKDADRDDYDAVATDNPLVAADGVGPAAGAAGAAANAAGAAAGAAGAAANAAGPAAGAAGAAANAAGAAAGATGAAADDGDDAANGGDVTTAGMDEEDGSSEKPRKLVMQYEVACRHANASYLVNKFVVTDVVREHMDLLVRPSRTQLSRSFRRLQSLANQPGAAFNGAHSCRPPRRAGAVQPAAGREAALQLSGLAYAPARSQADQEPALLQLASPTHAAARPQADQEVPLRPVGPTREPARLDASRRTAPLQADPTLPVHRLQPLHHASAARVQGKPQPTGVNARFANDNVLASSTALQTSASQAPSSFSPVVQEPLSDPISNDPFRSALDAHVPRKRGKIDAAAVGVENVRPGRLSTRAVRVPVKLQDTARLSDVSNLVGYGVDTDDETYQPE